MVEKKLAESKLVFEKSRSLAMIAVLEGFSAAYPKIEGLILRIELVKSLFKRVEAGDMWVLA